MATILPEGYVRWTCAIHGKPYMDCKCARPAHKRRNRFGNVAKRTVYNGVTYDSKAEAEYASLLDLWVKAGYIHAWIRQVTVPLGPDFKTRIDFLVFATPDEFDFREVKGLETARFKTVRRLWAKYGPCELHVLKKKGTIWSREVILGKRENK